MADLLPLLESGPGWTIADKYDPRVVRFADRHYSRQTPGSPQCCRPGHNMVLWHPAGAAWVWWRPIDAVGRKDALRAIECTLFRSECSILSSDLVRAAVGCLLSWTYYDAGYRVITGIGVSDTARRRSRWSLPGHCFRAAGWVDIAGKRSHRAECWLECPPEVLRTTPRLAPVIEWRGQMQMDLSVTPCP